MALRVLLHWTTLDKAKKVTNRMIIAAIIFNVAEVLLLIITPHVFTDPEGV